MHGKNSLFIIRKQKFEKNQRRTEKIESSEPIIIDEIIELKVGGY